VKENQVTGTNFVFYYGHAKTGAEGADFDNGPCDALGGEAAFREMVQTLHDNGIRIMLLDHVHRYANRDIPEFARYGLEHCAVQNKDGSLAASQLWWKETGLSCLYLDGPTPEWVEMCPYSEVWQQHYLHHLTCMVDLGVDGVEMDVLQGITCYSPNHGHAPGASAVEGKLQFLRRAREHVKRLNPDFVLIGENMTPETREVVDGYYPYRYPDETGRIFRYMFPEITQQAVLAGNYEYDQINKALQFCLGIETEIDGLRKTVGEGCPEMAAYIGEVNRLKRRYPDLLINGRFRDTIGAAVSGNIYYSVIEGADNRKALVLRNPTTEPQQVRADFADDIAGKAILWRPFAGEEQVTLPISQTLKPYEAAVVFSL